MQRFLSRLCFLIQGVLGEFPRTSGFCATNPVLACQKKTEKEESFIGHFLMELQFLLSSIMTVFLFDFDF